MESNWWRPNCRKNLTTETAPPTGPQVIFFVTIFLWQKCNQKKRQILRIDWFLFLQIKLIFGLSKSCNFLLLEFNLKRGKRTMERERGEWSSTPTILSKFLFLIFSFWLTLCRCRCRCLLWCLSQKWNNLNTAFTMKKRLTRDEKDFKISKHFFLLLGGAQG